MNTNKAIVNKAGAITTSVVSSGLLQPYQAKKFLQQTFDATPLMQAIRHEVRTEKSGEIDKIGIGKRKLRGKMENVDDGYRAGVEFGSIKYETTAVRLPWEITEETIRQNIEGENLENVITNLMTKQVGVDSEDLLINGDENVSKDNPDYDFLKLNTGIKKMIQDGGHVVDVSGTGGMDLEMFYKAVASIPNRFNNGNLRWLMSPTRAQQWELFLLEKITEKGGAVPQELYKSPVAIPSMQVPGLSNDAIILAEPKNLIEVNTYSMKLRKDATGIRYYVSSEKGKIYLRKRQEQTSMPILSLNSNIQSYDMSRSIYKTRTRLTLVTSKNAKKGSFVNSSLEKKIGKFADIQTVDEDVTKTELNQKISTFKKDTSIVDQELSVTATGDTRCVSGKCAYVQISPIGAKRIMFIEEDTHTFENGHHKMNLKLSYEKTK